jgi:type II secretory pathway pseudopilin PulG
MAIKGKRKSQKKPRSAAVARPRPVPGARAAASRGKRVPFYKTFRGQLATIIVVLIAIGAVMWFVSDRSSDSKALEAKQERLSAFTSEIRGYLQGSDQAIREMAGAPFNTQDEALLEGLAASSKSWVTAFQEAGAIAAALQGPEGLQPATRVFVQSLQAYTSAARTYGMVPQAEGKLQEELLARAGEQRQTANELVAAMISMIDQERAAADMRASGLPVPASLPPITPTPPATEENGSGGGGSKGDTEGKKGGGKKGDG